MANTKISQLPSWTGTAADLRWFVMNNSGENTTYKFSGYTSPYKRTGVNSVNNLYDTFAVGGALNTILGGFDNRIYNGNNSSVIGGTVNYINNLSDNNGIFGGYNNIMRAGVSSTMIGAGFNNDVSSTTLGFIGGTQDNTVTQGGNTFVLVGGGYNTVNNQNASAGNAMYSSYFCSDTTINDTSVIGSSNNWFSGSRNCNLVGYGKHNHISNSYNSTITNSVVNDTNTQWFNKIDSSSASTITTSKKSQILGGESNTILNKENVVMIGTSGRTANADYTTYVENLHTYRTPSTQVQPISSGTTFTCNLENGAKSQFYITGTSTINITNVRDGASFMIKTQTDGNYNMTWTATGGYTFVFEGGIKDPGNTTTDIFVFEVFGSVIYGNRRHNYS